MAAASTAACGTCAVCLQELLPEDEAFLDVCFHHFHLHCVRRWAATQLERPPELGPPLACPLCRRPFASAIFDCQGGTYQRQYFAAPASGRSTPASAAAATDGNSSFQLTAQHRRRRAVYSLPLSADKRRRAAERIARLAPQQAQRADVAQFAQRELQALLLQQDVALVAQHVVGTLQNAATTAAAGKAGAGQNGAASGRLQPQARRPLAGAALVTAARPGTARGTRPHAANGAAAAAAGDAQPPAPAVVSKLQAAAAPFLFENAERFAWELAAFAAAGQATVASFDRVALHLDAQAAAAAGAAARQQLDAAERDDGGRQQPSLAEQGQRAGSADNADGYGQSSSGESSERGRRRSAEPERSDSEGYLELLLRQGARRPLQANAAAQQQQQQQQQPEQQQQDGGQAVRGHADASPGCRSRSHASDSSSDAHSSSSAGDGRRRGSNRQAKGRRSSRSFSPPSHHRQRRKHKKRRRKRRSRSSSRSSRGQRSHSNGRDVSGRSGGDGHAPPSQPTDELSVFRQQALAAHLRHREGREQDGQQDGP